MVLKILNVVFVSADRSSFAIGVSLSEAVSSLAEASSPDVSLSEDALDLERRRRAGRFFRLPPADASVTAAASICASTAPYSERGGLHMCLDCAVLGEKATAEVDGEFPHGAVPQRHDVVGVVDEVTAEGDAEESALFGEEEDLEELVPRSRGKEACCAELRDDVVVGGCPR